MAADHQDMDRGELGTYVASVSLADLVRDLQERGLLTGAIRDSVVASLDHFIAQRSAEPMDAWHVDLIDLYEDLTGKPPSRGL